MQCGKSNRVAPKPELKLILARDREQAAAGRLVRARRIAGLARRSDRSLWQRARR
jgi:hypothetical protein